MSSNIDPVDELITSIQKQTLRDTEEKSTKLPQPAKQFQKELEKTNFEIFKSISDLGFFGWKPDLKDQSPFNKVSVKEINRQLDVEGKPRHLVDLRKITLPVPFYELPPQIYANQYPMSHYDIAGIYVATKIRGVPLEDIDFVFGGSTLSMLASHNESKKVYYVTKIPGTSAALVVKEDDYDYNFAEPGFQFERLVTGKPMDEKTKPYFVEHMHLMQVGSYKILFITEVDSMKDDEPVEVTCSNPKYWGINKCLQCVSSGSPVLCHGSKYRGKHVTTIRMKPLNTLYDDERVNLTRAEKKITQALEDMKQQLERSTHSGDHEIHFSMGRLTLIPQNGSSKVLPPFDSVNELLLE